MAQKQFTLEDLNFGGTNYHNMVAKNRYTTWWGSQLVRLDADRCSLVNKTTGKEQPLFTLDQLNRWMKTDESTKVHSLYYVSFPYAGKSLVYVMAKGRRYLVDFKKHKTVWQQDAAAETLADWNAVSRNVAYVKDYNLFVRTADGEEHQISNDASREILYGTSVHRDEFGWSKGTFWSPNGEKLLFTRMDQTMVSDYPQVIIPEVDWQPEEGQSRIATPAPDKYPMAGEKMHKVTLGVYDVKTGQTVYLKAGDPTDRYFTNPAWSPDGRTVYLFELNRDQNDCQLVSYNAETGERIAELYRETDPKYVEPLHPIVFLPWDPNYFVMQSQRDGYNHLYLYKKDGTLVRQITSGPWVVMEMLGFDSKHKAIIYASNECSPIQRNLWIVDVNTGKRALYDNGAGWHNGMLSADGLWLVDNWQEPDVPRKICITSMATARHTPYFTADDPWKGYSVPEYRCGTIKAADGVTDLYYRMVMPVGFDPSKKYPTIVYVYGGPHAHNVDARWHYCSRSWETYMAQKGYLLFIVDNRGSENRGKAFEQVTFRHLGIEEMKDQMEGVKFLKTLPYVDASRLGVHGWSFGGFMTTNLMLTYPDIFKVGVAGGPVIDWKFYEVMYGERYMDTPQANPEGYKGSDLKQKASNLKGRLEIIIGGTDPTCVPQHTYTFLRACIEAGTHPDLFIYPEDGHNMMGRDRVHLHEHITRYFEDHLK